MEPQEYILVTLQPGARDVAEHRAYYTPGQTREQLVELGHLLADGATPEMGFWVLPAESVEHGSV